MLKVEGAAHINTAGRPLTNSTRPAGRPVPDSEIVAALPTHINRFAGHIWPPGRPVSRPIPGALALVETAGGPASPGPSGTLQVGGRLGDSLGASGLGTG